jgi:hypothetical protein
MSQLFSHSAEVDAWLECEHGRLPLRRITAKSVVVKEAREIPACYADLVVSIDGQIQRMPVWLRSGFTRGRCAALFDYVATVATA